MCKSLFGLETLLTDPINSFNSFTNQAKTINRDSHLPFAQMGSGVTNSFVRTTGSGPGNQICKCGAEKAQEAPAKIASRTEKRAAIYVQRQKWKRTHVEA